MQSMHEWESFYVIIGSSAAALTGLMFVVVALMSDVNAPRNVQALQAFASPTIVHFCAVILLAAFMTMPIETNASLRLCFALSGLAGFLYAAWVTIQAKRQKAYTPELEDWIFHSVLPLIAYAGLLVSGLMLREPRERALLGVGVSALLLLFIGIHNAWDAAVWMMLRGPETNEENKIRDVIDRWQRATRDADLDAVLKLIADDAVFLQPGKPPMTKDGFAAAFKSLPRNAPIDARQDIKEIHVTSDHAFCWSHLTVIMEGKTRSGHVLTIFRQNAEGAWVLSRDANLLS